MKTAVEEKIDGLILLVKEKFKNNDEVHESVLAQVTKTNGRVRALEKWRYFIMGAVAFIGFMTTVGISISAIYLR